MGNLWNETLLEVRRNFGSTGNLVTCVLTPSPLAPGATQRIEERWLGTRICENTTEDTKVVWTQNYYSTILYSGANSNVWGLRGKEKDDVNANVWNWNLAEGGFNR